MDEVMFYLFLNKSRLVDSMWQRVGGMPPLVRLVPPCSIVEGKEEGCNK